MKIKKRKQINNQIDRGSQTPKNVSLYDVGYCKPPIHTRFKAGQSGNPRGRKKGYKNFNTLLRLSLNQKIEVVISGHKRKLPNYVVIISRLVHQALEGKLKAIQLLLPYILQMERAEAELAQKVQSLHKNDKEILLRYAKKLSK